MNLRILTLSALLGAGVALALSSCGSVNQPTKCLAWNCEGCCDSDDRCVETPGASACGVGGQACVSCGLGEQCVAGSCSSVMQPVPDAGMPKPDAGCSCQTGCCTAEGQCAPGNQAVACGLAGATCAACSSGATCVNGECKVPTVPDGGCGGCVDPATAECKPGLAPAACGAQGAVCVACFAGQMCKEGKCQGGAKCDAQSCPSGCCAGDTCVAPPTDIQCGTGGAACVGCGTKQRCEAGVCIEKNPPAGDGGIFPGQDGGLPTSCNASNCPDGCCAGGLICQPGNTVFLCGSGGQACKTCSLLQLPPQTCVNQACQ